MNNFIIFCLFILKRKYEEIEEGVLGKLKTLFWKIEVGDLENADTGRCIIMYIVQLQRHSMCKIMFVCLY